MNIGLLVIATNKYIQFVPPLWESAQRYFLADGGHNVRLFVFTNQPAVPPGACRIEQEHLPWPCPTLLRYHFFCQSYAQLESCDYLYYCDADMLFTAPVGPEVLGDLVATLHPGYYDRPAGALPYERRPDSAAFVPLAQGRRYYAGGFNGGRTACFMAMALELVDMINRDMQRNLVARWHDESYFNRFLVDHPPTVELPPAYCYPGRKTIPFERKLVALDKDHAALRS